MRAEKPVGGIEPALASLFDRLPDGVCVSDAGGRLLYLNPAAERLLDLRAPAALGRTTCELLCGRLATADAPECASNCPLRDARSPDRAVTFVGRYGPQASFRWREDGVKRLESGRHLRVHCVRMSASPGEPERHATIIEDVTAERELERLKADWRHMIAHDFRAPLGIVYTALKMIQENITRADPSPVSAELVDAAVRGCKNIAELLDLYLDVARLEAGLMPAEPAVVDLAALAGRVVSDFAPVAQERRVSVTADVAAGLSVVADESLLARSLRNLVDNAIKFTRAGGRVTIAAASEGPGRVALSVRDSGVGIPPEEIPLLFERYRQTRGGRSEHRGTGLGLAFCRHALRAMDGEISVESRPGEGSVFTLHLRSS